MGIKEDIEGLLNQFREELPREVDKRIDERLKSFTPQEPCKGDKCPARQTAGKVEELSEKIVELSEQVKVKLSNPPEKTISMDEAMRLGLDDIIEKKEQSPYYEIFDKRKELLVPKEEKGGEQQKEPEDEGARFRKAWC